MDMIKLDVGGSLYTTSRSTLTSYPDSMLGAMFSGRVPSACAEHGRYVVDGDGTIFRYVLNFLRHSKLDLPEDFKDLDLLATEADFYQIKELIDAVSSLRDKKKAERGCKIQKLEFIEIGVGQHDHYYYLGHQNTLKQIPTLFDSIQKGYKYMYKINFEESRMQCFQEIASLGFEFVTTSQPWLFKRKL